MNPKVEHVIISDTPIGTGKNWNSPCRMVTQVFTFNGELIAEKDHNSYTIEQLEDLLSEVLRMIIMALKITKY